MVHLCKDLSDIRSLHILPSNEKEKGEICEGKFLKNILQFQQQERKGQKMRTQKLFHQRNYFSNILKQFQEGIFKFACFVTGYDKIKLNWTPIGSMQKKN